MLSIAGIINPSVLDANIASRDIFIMLGATLLLILMSLSLTGQRRINRLEGGILVASFVGYIYYII